MIARHEARDLSPRLDFTHKRADDWRDQALCAQTGAVDEVWMPGKGSKPRRAIAICKRCPVIDECLEHALSSPEPLDGVWGGTSHNERKAMRRARRDQESAA